MKRFLASILCVITVVSLVFGGSISALAETDWGTPEEGIIPTRANLSIYHVPYLETDGFPNFNFDRGFKYWTSSCLSGARLYSPSQAAKLATEGENTYIKLTPTEPYGNIHTVQFVDSRIKVDDALVIMYDWRNTTGDANLQVTLNQYFRESPEKLGSHNGTRLSDCGNGGVTDLKVALNDDEWNTSMGRVYQPVQKPTGADQAIYLSVGIESIVEVTETQVDNIRIAKFVKTTGDVLDLDNNKLFNIHDLELGGDAEDVISDDDFADIDYEAENEEITKDNSEATEENASSQESEKSFIESYNMFSGENWSGSSWWKPAVATGVIVIIIAGITVAVILVCANKKRKTAVPEVPEDNSTEKQESQE